MPTIGSFLNFGAQGTFTDRPTVYGRLIPGENAAAVDGLGAVEAMRMAQPPAASAEPGPETENPRGRAVA